MTYGQRRPAPWLFGITILPYGVYSGFISTAMPYLLRKAGLPVDRIAGISALALAPALCYFVWSPLADVGLRRRTWLILMSVLSAGCLGAALLQPLPSGLDWFTSLVIVGEGLNTLVAAANGGLMAETIPNSERGQTGGWYMAGNVGGGALGAGVTLWLAPRISADGLASAVAAMMILPSFAALLISEPPPVREPIRGLMEAMLSELKIMFRTKSTLTGLAMLLSPMGAAAAANLFSSIAEDYRASETTVVWITGLGGGLFTALGSLAAGFVCDRISRRVAYALAALVSAVCAAAMMAAPLTPLAFALGAAFYLASQGVAFAAYQALTLELVGPAGRSASTRYTIYNSAGNLPVMYMTWIDGQGYKRSGVRGLLGVDAFSNLAAALICLALLRRRDKTK